MNEYDLTPAGVLRSTLGEPAIPPDVERFRDELPGKVEAHRAFQFAWGLEDAAGRPTARAEQRRLIYERHQENMHALNWIRCTETEERELIRRMSAAKYADHAAATAEVTGPGELNSSDIAAMDKRRQVMGGIA